MLRSIVPRGLVGVSWAVVRRSLLPLACLSLLLISPGCGGNDLGAEGDSEDESGTAETGDDDDDPVEPYDEFPGLSAEVEVKFDDRGIPHIYAANDDDLFFASGYQMAVDRLFQMDLTRRRALGRQAEVLGESAIDQDIVSRTFDLQRWGSLNAERLRGEAPDVYNSVIAWIAGVNARIAEIEAGDAPLPYGFAEAGYTPEPWDRDDEYAIAKLLYLGNSNSLERDLLATIIRRNLPEVWDAFELSKPMFEVAIMPEDEIPAGLAPDSRPSTRHLAPAPVPLDPHSPQAVADALSTLHGALAHLGVGRGPFGSNSWALDGRHTADGRSLIANDPHQPLDSPSLMYAQHLDSITRGEGSYDVIGFSFSGTMGVQLGHNRRLHWTATTNFADVMDLWEVRVEDNGVWIGEDFVEWDVREEVIEVAGGEPRVLELRDVPGYGVILPPELIPLPVAGPGRELLVNWTGFAGTNEEQCFARMAQAQDLDSWEEGVDLMEVAGFNFVAATADEIAYRVNILVPDRDLSSGALPYLVMDGDDPRGYWDGYLPASQLPRSRLTNRGWVATANNDPWGFTFDGDVTNDPFYYGYFYAAGHRAQRLDEELERLTEAGGVTLADMRALQLDTHSVLADALLPVLDDAVAAIGSDAALAEFEGDADLPALVEQLAGWDRRMDRDSAAALVWHVWLHSMAWEVAEDDLSFLYTLVFNQEPPFVIKIPALALLEAYPSTGLTQEGPRWLALSGLRITAQWLRDTYGDIDPSGYSWGDMHGTRFDNPAGELAPELDGGWVSTNGGEDTLDVSSSKFYAGSSNPAPPERLESTSGAIFRVVTSFAEDGTPVSEVNFPRGNAGEPSSPHWDDTLEDWVEGVYTPMPYREAEVDAATESSYRLTPSED